MSRTLTLTHDYPAPARAVWDLATDFASFQETMGRLIVFDTLPSGRIAEGQSIDVRVSLFGLLPWQDYRMTVESCDHEAMTFQSDESGAGVKSWRHQLTVTETATGSRLTDQVELDAGWRTFLFLCWAKVVYRARHKPRLRMLKDRRNAD